MPKVLTKESLMMADIELWVKRSAMPEPIAQYARIRDSLLEEEEATFCDGVLLGMTVQRKLDSANAESPKPQAITQRSAKTKAVSPR